MKSFRHYVYKIIANEISPIAKYSDCLLQWLSLDNDDLLLFNAIENNNKLVIDSLSLLSDFPQGPDFKATVLINGAINYEFDIQGQLSKIFPFLSRSSRVIIVAYNPYLGWLYRLANWLGLRRGALPTTFVTRIDLENIAKTAGFSLVRTKLVGYLPWSIFGLGDLINRILPCIPLIKWLAFAYIAVLRPCKKEEVRRPSLSCVIPARNELGNIENAITRFPNLNCDVEVIFIEGHSTDKTWEEILRVQEKYKAVINIKALQQTGKGKADAVRLGFSAATCDLLTILDADLTMPPELLGRFYGAYCDGYGDFINGSRLLYPMEGKAMRFLNRLGNIFFAKALSWILDVRIGDSLCGTKLFLKRDYERMIAWRNDFGDFDPFGDFELIFPAAVMGLGIVDIPIRYRDRSYGATNINRFRHGLMLLRMTLIGFFKIKMRIRFKRSL